MRITNQMTMNKMLININRNQSSVDSIYTQITSGKKIQMPSDDPIIASRALKFRTTLSQTVQYQKNTAQGLAWMNISEGGFSNAIDILKSIRERCVEGASDTFTYDDRQKISTAIKTLAEQIGAEMNISYAGRYVYSGYRTDIPPIVELGNPDADYTITQQFKLGDIELTKAYIKADAASTPNVSDIYRIKLPYTEVENLSIDIPGFTINEVDMSDPAQRTAAYTPAAGEINYIPETGELIIGADDMNAVRAAAPNGFSVEYDKKGLVKGELNPVVYFNCTDNVTGKSYTMDAQNLQYEFGLNTKLTINNLAKDALTANLFGDLRALTDLLDGISLSSESDLFAKFKAQGLSDEEANKAVEDQLNEEMQKYRSVMQKSFSNMLGLIDSHNSQISTEYTLLGSRMNTLQLIENRLADDKASYTELMSNNENIDYLEVLMNLNSAEYVYNAALKAGGGIAQISLVDFIR